MDMYSGGGQKEAFSHLFIEAPESEAKVIFCNRFGHNPERVTCTCCGDDYSISEAETLAEATGFERGCEYAYFDKDGTELGGRDVFYSTPIEERGNLKGGYVERPTTTYSFYKYQTLDEYVMSGKAVFIYAADIKPEERKGDVPQQGYVWAD